MSWLNDPELRAAVMAEAERLGTQWYGIVTEFCAEPLGNPTQTRLNSLAHNVLEHYLAETEDAQASRRFGQTLYEIIGVPNDIVVDLHVALAERICAALPAKLCARAQPRLIRLAGEVEAGYFTAYQATQQAFNIRELRRVRHDLKTPINAVTGFSKVMLKGIDGPITELQREDLNTIFESGRQLLNMIDDLTATLIRDDDKIALTTDSVDAAALVGDVVATAQPLVATRSCDLSLHVSGELGTLKAPLTYIRWIFLSPLLVLARVAQPGAVELRVTRVQEGGQKWLDVESSATALEDDALQTVKKAASLVPTQRYCRKLGGLFEVEANESGEVRVKIRLPAVVPADVAL